jgi:hypothetical protein
LKGRGFSRRGNASCRKCIPSGAKAQNLSHASGGAAKAEPFQNTIANAEHSFSMSAIEDAAEMKIAVF